MIVCFCQGNNSFVQRNVEMFRKGKSPNWNITPSADGRVLCVVAMRMTAWWCHQIETLRVTGPFVRGIHTGHRRIPHTKASHAGLWYFLWFAPWVNNREPGDLRRHRAHYGVIVMSVNCRVNPYRTGHFYSQCNSPFCFNLYTFNISV